MTVKKIHCLLIALLGVAIASCEKEPSTSDLHRDYLVYTACDPETDFAAFDTYYLPDSILLIGSSDKTEYWKDESALKIIRAVADNLDARNFTRVEDKEAANLGVQLSYVKRVTYFVGYDYPYWWGYYPYYWSPGYWGDWIGWHYPFPVYYGYTAGSLLTEILDLEGDRQTGKKLPVLWDSFIGGLLSPSETLNMNRTIEGVNQAFVQSPTLTK